MNEQHYNGLSPALAERLAMLGEEAGEIVQMVGKILRHGADSHHPSDPERTPNMELLRREVVDLKAVALLMEMNQDLKMFGAGEIVDAMVRKRHYTHHQGENRNDA